MGPAGSPGRSSSSWPGTSPSRHGAARSKQTTRAALARLAPLRDSLRTGVIHGDVTDDNIVVDPSDPEAPAGVIDFGDVSRGWLVAELAVAVASALHHVPAEPLRVLETIDAFAAHVPLTDAEIAALWPLVVLRAAVLVVSGEQQVAVDADNTYADENRAHEWLVFAVARRVDSDEAESLIRWRLQQNDPASESSVELGRLFGVDLDEANVLDLSVTSHLLDDGRWLEPGIEDRLLNHVGRSTGAAVTRYGEFRLTRSVPESALPTPTFALAVTACGARRHRGARPRRRPAPTGGRRVGARCRTGWTSGSTG